MKFKGGGPKRPVAEKFWEKVGDKPDIGCWEWIASCREGYGYLRTETTDQAHRVSWELHYGPIPEGGTILHTCDNTKCVRPDHLRLGTQLENMQDMKRKGRRKINTLSPDQMEIIRKAPDGMLETLARGFGVTVSAVRQIRRGRFGIGHRYKGEGA